MCFGSFGIQAVHKHACAIWHLKCCTSPAALNAFETSTASADRWQYQCQCYSSAVDHIYLVTKVTVKSNSQGMIYLQLSRIL